MMLVRDLVGLTRDEVTIELAHAVDYFVSKFREVVKAYNHLYELLKDNQQERAKLEKNR